MHQNGGQEILHHRDAKNLECGCLVNALRVRHLQKGSIHAAFKHSYNIIVRIKMLQSFVGFCLLLTGATAAAWYNQANSERFISSRDASVQQRSNDDCAAVAELNDNHGNAAAEDIRVCAESSKTIFRLLLVVAKCECGTFLSAAYCSSLYLV